MTNDQLEKANRLKEEITKLDNIIFFAKRDGWYGRLIKKAKQLIFREQIYGLADGRDYELSKDLEAKIVKVLEEELNNIKNELANL